MDFRFNRNPNHPPMQYDTDKQESVTMSSDRSSSLSPDLTPGTMSRWFPGHRHDSFAQFRLFCFHHAGGTAAVFREWPRRLPPEVDVCPLQLPGRAGRLAEPCFTQLVSLAESVSSVIRPLLDRPFAFFGHSMGAILCFELALQLRKQGAPTPACMFVSAHRAPQEPRHGPICHRLPEPEFREVIRRFDGTPEPVLENEELLQIMLPVLRADFTACETYNYIPAEPFDCPIHALAGLDDARVPSRSLEGWREHTNGLFTMDLLPGGHFYIQSASDQLTRLVTRYIMRQLDTIRS
jgi:medium-chain acyl-[acyl-carrier-protein] hydrolase